MKTKFKRIGRQSLSVILAVMMMVSTMLVGMVTTNATISYWILRGTFNEWSTDTQFQFGGSTGGSITYDLTSYKGKTIEFRTDAFAVDENPSGTIYNSTGSIVSAGTEYELTWNKGDTMKYTVSSSGSGMVTFTVVSKNGKNYLTVTEEPVSSKTYYVAGKTGLVGGTTNWETGDYNKMEYNSTTGIYSITFNNVAKGTYQFKFTDGGSTWKGDDSFTKTSIGCIADNGFILIGGNFQIETTQEANITITYDGDKTVTVNAVSSTQDTTVAPDTTVPSTTAPSGGESTATTYKLMVSRSSDGLAAVKDTTVYQLGENSYYVIVPANTFKKGNNFFALSSDGNKTGILSYSGSSRDDTISADVEQIGRQENGGKEFVFVSFQNDIAYDVKITYNSGNYTISRAAAPVTKYKVNVTSSNATVKINGDEVASGSYAQVAENSEYTLSVAPASGYYITRIYVGGSPISEAITNPYIENSFTKSMGTADVEVKVETAESPSYNISTAFDNNQGNVTVSSTSCKAGDTFTVTVTPNTNYAVDTVVAKYGETELTATTTSGTTYTYTMPASDVTVTVTFKESQGTLTNAYYLMHSTSDNLWSDSSTVKSNLPCYQDGDNYSITIDKSALGSSNYFAFTTSNSTTDSKTYMVEKDAANAPSLEFDKSIFSAELKNNNSGNNYYFIYTRVNDLDSVKSVTVTYNPSEHKYTLSADAIVLTDKVYLYAAKGTQGGNQFADSIDYVDGISEGYTKETNEGNYKVFRAHKGDNVRLKYTMNSGRAQAGYYIYALVVDGKKVEVTRADDLVYVSAPITLTNDKTEVTPVYYNSVIEGAGDYITVYATAPQAITEKWGNTLAIYTWFSSNASDKKYGDGSYPGQPMMQEGDGKYVAKVAKYYYSYDSTNNKVTKEDTLIKGLLLNSFAENQISRQSIFLNDNQQENNQTYDYDDFVKIAAMGYDTVQFDIKYASSTTTTNQKLVVNDAINAPDPSTNTAPTPATSWEDLKNIDGKDVSILGYDDATIQSMDNRLTGLNRDQSIKIISVGNQNIYVNGDTWSTEKIDGATQNKWSTIWYVYGTDGKFVTRGLPSDFIPRGNYDKETGKFTESVTQTAAYNAIVEHNLQYTSAQISYEVRMDTSTSVDNKRNDDGTLQSTGVRVDGRWYYARSAEKANVEVGIIYKNGDTYTTDTPTNADIENNPFVGTTTGATASISYSDSNGDHAQIAKASVNRNTKVTFTADNSTTYKFIGWSTTETPTPDQIINDGDYAVTVGSATKLYAVYEPYASGKLVLNHSKYNGAGANGGVGTYYIKAEVVDPTDNNKVVKTYGGNPTDSSVEIANTYINESSTYKIKVTLYTKPSANSTFVSFYGYEENDFTTVKGSTTKTDSNGLFVSKTYEIDPKTLFSEGKQTVNAVNYYTDLKLPVLASEIVFNYQPYKNAPNPDPQPGKGTGTTTFTVTIKDKDGNVVTPESIKGKETSSLTLSATGNIKDIVDNYVNHSIDYTITITMKPVADSHCHVGKTYLQGNEYTEVRDVDTAADTITVTLNLKDLYSGGKFTTNTVNYYTDFTADEYTFNATFEYLGYESRKYFDEKGYGTPLSDDLKNELNAQYKKTFTVNQKITGADIDKYLKKNDQGNYILTDQFLIDFAPYEDNFVQTITWDIGSATLTVTDNEDSETNKTVSATITATYDTHQFTVEVRYPEALNESVKQYSVYYAELVVDANDEFQIEAPKSYKDSNDEIQYFNYWSIKVGDQEVAKCYNTEFNYRIYDNYTLEAVYSNDQSASVRPGTDSGNADKYSTIQLLEYSRNKYYDNGKKEDKVYADFAISYYYGDLQLRNYNNDDLEVGVVFAFDKAQNSADKELNADGINKLVVSEYIKTGNNKDNLKFINKIINKQNLDNKNRVEYSWRVDNLPANQQLTLVAYSYIYDKNNSTVIISEGQKFKFYEVGNQTYKITTNS